MTIIVERAVQEALDQGAPVVALESSNITAGVLPANLELARDMDAAVAAHGALPARVAMLDGSLHVGLTEDELVRIATEHDEEKVSTRDLAVGMARNATAGTTVSASLIASVAAGIRVFAVAGIGGVHRGAETSFDISTDLTQFQTSPSLVVCAGAKSLLDPRLTLEYLETAGVPVIGYASDDFPGYLAVSSGERNPLRSDDLQEIARIAHHHWADVTRSAVLVTSPLPAEDGVDPDVLLRLINDALEEAATSGASGAALTPFVQRAVAAATNGRSSTANRAALLSTVSLAADLAVEEAAVRQADPSLVTSDFRQGWSSR
ncbi:pseudouridine-5'-phosphate glycosidase [Curtobacterium flaccumfaciens]|uniref:pseudouridine-5'-phosphate glycosidase n=1 Tax=Curtobacterium flaccumfaciens TaxID=2035 RepID=UPI00188BE4B7|nr:pseudouridine-5'-phosphate glycosidase [Curtobacterium flaccumfaciens]MBF4592363.1 pseudouridine-5'-phosphate glycosidase [Curtobacterium flaccumfaciens]